MEPTPPPVNPPEPSVDPPAPVSIPITDLNQTATPPAPAPSPPAVPEQPVYAQPSAAPAISQAFEPANSAAPPPPPFASTAAPDPAPPVSPFAPAPPAAPMPGVVVGGGGLPSTASEPAAGTTAPVAPVVSSRRRLPKKVLIPVIAAVVLLGAAATFYFGYYANPSVIYSQSLKDTGKGYDQLLTYADQQSKLDGKGYTGSGSYSVKTSSFSTDGKITYKSDNKNAELTFDIGIAGTRINTDIRALKSSGTTPDLYIKAGNIKGLGTVAGIPELDPTLAKLDNTWIAVDHTFIDSLEADTTQTGSASIMSPTRSQILDEAHAFGRVNQQYVFSTAKDKAITKVVKKYGIETVDGHKAYHYKIVLQKDNVKKYILAQRDALKGSTLNDWLKKNKLDKDAYNSFNDAANSTKDIKSSDTYDIWMDVNQRVVYKVRFSDKKNPANTYTDVGLDYKGGTIFPFFINDRFKDSGQVTTFSLTTTVDTKSGNTDLKLAVKADGSVGGTVNANFSFKPSTDAIKIAKPSGAIPFSQVLSELGYGDALDSTSTSAAPTAAGGPAAIQLGSKLSTNGKTTNTSGKTVQDSLLQRLFKQ